MGGEGEEWGCLGKEGWVGAGTGDGGVVLLHDQCTGMLQIPTLPFLYLHQQDSKTHWGSKGFPQSKETKVPLLRGGF